MKSKEEWARTRDRLSVKKFRELFSLTEFLLWYNFSVGVIL